MKQKITFLILSILLIGLFSFFQYDKVIEEQKEDETETILSLTIDGEKVENFPSKESGKTIERIECEEGVNAFWDYETWGPVIKNVTKNKTKCQFHFVSRYHENILNGADPVLKSGLIPVTIENDGTIKKADLSKEWYNYSNQKWANAIVLEDESIQYQNGEVIPESNIESYFVWIPRYKYKIWDLGNYTSLTAVQKKEQTIEIIFEDKNIEESKGNTIGSYLTHPAFTAFDVNGIWVGKFETGYKGATNLTVAQQNIQDTDKVEIKPNVYSWRGIQVANAHLNSYNYKREYESHMMKNTEWGAVAYLQHSMYGSRNHVRVNNNSNFITGYSAVNEPTCGYTEDNRDCNRYEGTSLNVDGTYTKRYNSEVGYLASTTGNISGVYDMSGGSWEYVMGVMLNTNGTPCAGRDATYTSGFSGPFCGTTGNATGISLPEKKYYDTYTYGTDDEHYNRRILGDATGEMGPFSSATYGTQTRQINSWFQNESDFVWTYWPWFLRGTFFGHGISAGVFAFAHYAGNGYTYGSFRITLAI